MGRKQRLKYLYVLHMSVRKYCTCIHIYIYTHTFLFTHLSLVVWIWRRHSDTQSLSSLLLSGHYTWMQACYHPLPILVAIHWSRRHQKWPSCSVLSRRSVLWRQYSTPILGTERWIAHFLQFLPNLTTSLPHYPTTNFYSQRVLVKYDLTMIAISMVKWYINELFGEPSDMPLPKWKETIWKFLHNSWMIPYKFLSH